MTIPDLFRRRGALFLIIVAYFAVGYLICSWINVQRWEYWTGFLPGERAIPFIPAAIFGYFFAYAGMLLIYFVEDDARHFFMTWQRFMALLTIHFLCFLLFPFRMERPIVIGTDLSILVTRWFYSVDQPVNLFPSLHVALPLLATLQLWTFKRRWAIAYAVMTAIIAVSVVLVKQHYIIDVLGAVVTATLVRGIRMKYKANGYLANAWTA